MNELKSFEVKQLINTKNFDLVLNQNNKSIIGYFKNTINSRLETNLFDLFDNHLDNCIKSDNKIEINIVLARILCLCSQFNDLCLKSDIKSNEVTKNDEIDDINSHLIKVSNYFENFELKSGLKCLKQLRSFYGIGNKNITDLYDICVKTLIKNCVKTVFKSVFIEENESFNNIALNEWVIAKSPARIDLQGGWTDTPPICYELGGRVLNIAVRVNNKKPIGAKARKVELCGQQLISIKEYDFNRKLLNDLKLNDIKEFFDYCDPDSCGSLIKSALICCQIIDIKNPNLSLCEQLQRCLNSGLEIELWSNLPQGSGLGTSSILSGCVIAVLWTLLGKKFTKTSLLNAVLYVEQLMSTGGGWQDQVGGLVGGFKLGRSHNSLPLKIDYKVLDISDGFKNQFEKHLVLIYSGSVRLAKNLLQNVIQNWYIRDQRITECFNQLLTNTDLCFEAILKEDLKSIGDLLSKYWEQKKILAPNSEPKQVSEFFKRVEPLINGGSLCGAGGGGFMALIVKEPNFKNQIISMTEQYLPDSKVYDCLIDDKGLQLSINDIKYEISD